jgi:hypothetical protein
MADQTTGMDCCENNGMEDVAEDGSGCGCVCSGCC